MYAKIFSSLWKGSLHGSGPTWAVFVYLLAHADADGNVEIVPEAIRDDTGFDLVTVGNALQQLCAPDERSRTDSEDGRRLIPIDDRGWGWHVVNYEKYRNLRDNDTLRAQTRARVQRHREKKRTVTLGNAPLRQEEVEVEVEVDESTPLLEMPVTNGHAKSNSEHWLESFHEHFWPAYPAKVSKPHAIRAWKAVKPHSQDQFTRVMSGLHRWSRYWTDNPDRKVCYPATWINGSRWEDDPS